MVAIRRDLHQRLELSGQETCDRTPVVINDPAPADLARQAAEMVFDEQTLAIGAAYFHK
jgi:hypothetical protein